MVHESACSALHVEAATAAGGRGCADAVSPAITPAEDGETQPPKGFVRLCAGTCLPGVESWSTICVGGSHCRLTVVPTKKRTISTYISL